MAPDADAARSAKRADPFAPLTSEMLAVSDGHEIYVESVGRADGIPAVYLHGGPGSGCQPDHRRLFDPERVSGIVLRATFLGTRAEVETGFTVRLPQFYPALNEDFLSVLPPEERGQPIDAYWRRILDPDPAVHGPAARAWHDTERTLSEHKPARTRLDPATLNSSRALPATPFMEVHYFVNDCFMAPDQLLRNADKLAGIRGIIIQGRYDLLCPPETSQTLAKVWPGSEIRIVEEAGHSLYDPGVRDAVMKGIADLGTTIAREESIPSS